MPDYLKYSPDLIDTMQGKEMGKCNCPSCIDDRQHDNYAVIAAQINPDLDWLPRELDKAYNWNQTRPERRHEDARGQWDSIFKALDLLRTKNRRAAGQYKRHGVKYNYCRDCGTIVKEEDGSTVNYWWNREWQKDSIVCPKCRQEWYSSCDDCDALWFMPTMYSYYFHGSVSSLDHSYRSGRV
ncbi:MAG: hypothetical protein ACXABY_21190, partial [Candidatus Thorarchaeota archaeon]